MLTRHIHWSFNNYESKIKRSNTNTFLQIDFGRLMFINISVYFPFKTSGDESSFSLVHRSEDASVQSKSPAMCLCVMICNLYWFSLKAAQPLSLLHAEHVVLNPLGSWVLDIIVLIQNSSGGLGQMLRSAVLFDQR